MLIVCGYELICEDHDKIVIKMTITVEVMFAG